MPHTNYLSRFALVAEFDGGLPRGNVLPNRHSRWFDCGISYSPHF